MRIQTESNWMRIRCALVMFTWATILGRSMGITSTLHVTDQSTTRVLTMADLSVIAVTLLFLLRLHCLHHQLLTRDTRLAYHLPHEGFLSCDFLSTSTFYIGNSVRMRIETPSGGDFDQCKFNSLWMRIEIMHIHVNTTNAHRMRIHASMWKGL